MMNKMYDVSMREFLLLSRIPSVFLIFIMVDVLARLVENGSYVYCGGSDTKCFKSLSELYTC